MNRFCSFSLVFLCLSCTETFVPDNASTEMNLRDFEVAWNHIDGIYPLFDFKNIDWQSLYDEYQSRTAQTKGDDFYQVLIDLVGELQDPHAAVITQGGTRIRPYTTPRMIRSEGTFSPNIVRKYFSEPLLVIANQAIEYQFLTDKIGYVWLPTFGGKLRGRQHEFEEVIRYFSQAEGLIIDIRENNGGGSSVYDPIVSYLISEPVSSGYQVRTNELIEPVLIEPHPNLRFNRDIVLLTNGTTFSAGEVFADRLKDQAHVTLVGDTTAGGGMSANADPVIKLPSGKSISLHYTAILRKDSIVLEWNGVDPDMVVNQTIENIRDGRDLILEFAIDLLNN